MKNLKVTVLVTGVLLAFALLSCEKEELTTLEPEAIATEKGLKVCVEKWDTDTDLSKAATLKAKQWNPGQVIRVKFLNGNSYVQSKVRQYAKAWEDHANITFQFVSTNSSANIKISFREGQYANDGGSWSYLGTDANNYSRTMHYGWFNDNTSETDFRTTTIHEFGHALGLIHEHQNPVAGINWDREAVYAYYAGPPNYWSRAQVDNNLFRRYEASTSNYSAYDPASIMHYPIPAEHTLDGFSVGTNTNLSDTDKSFIATVYPGDTGGDDICSGVSPYVNGESYSVGDQVTYQGYLFERTASGWTNLGECGAPPADICAGVDPYVGGQFYAVGDQVTYQGYLFERTTTGWTNLGQCGS
ncbi:matrixin family metalloprotease [Aquimarina brevivitae]|nr:matrixin family metalloprotease [Aquimarina brevivitae]